MITRIFRVRVPAALHGEFEDQFRSISVPCVMDAQGVVSVSIGRPTQWAPEEYCMVSVWADEGSLKAFAGEDWSAAVIPDGMEKYVSESWVHHYENFT